ncbi:hypothetical protein GW17_00041390 [Ensete ventricosum]|nr:hypothetical protein GW17_00041390 [Ensete ventricosum]
MGREWQWSTSPLSRGAYKESHPGCMSSMLHYLHFQHLLFTGSSSKARAVSSLSLPPRIDHNSQQLEGMEAPRNSLELDDGKASSATSTVENEFYDVPVGIEIAPRLASVSKNKKKMLIEEGKRSSSAETLRTPCLVARLMGLEISAEQASSPMPKTPPLKEPQAKSRVRNNKKNVGGHQSTRTESPSRRQPLGSLSCNIASSPRIRMEDAGSRSLPETPRVSSATSCDVDPRFSLQLNKSTRKAMKEELSYFLKVIGNHLPSPPSAYSATRSRKKDFVWHQDENRIPRSHRYAREIVEQVKESISSRRGRGGDGGCSGGDGIRSKSKRTRPTEKKLSNPPAPCSPLHVRVLEIRNNDVKDGAKKSPTLPPKSLQSQATGHMSSSRTSIGTPDYGKAKGVKMVVSKCKKNDNDRFTERIIRKETQSPTPTSASVFQSAGNRSSRSSLPSTVKRRVEEASQPVSVSRSSLPLNVRKLSTIKHSYVLIGVGGGKDQSNNPEFRYMKSIFERAGIAGIHTVRWYSPWLPIDPIVFHQLELEFPFFLVEEEERCKGIEEEEEEEVDLLVLGPLRYRSNRKLLFHLVEEILRDLLTGCCNLTPSFCRTSDREALLRQLWGQIESFPAADCRMVGDIDALVARDLPEAQVRLMLRHPSVVEEADDVVYEVEKDILNGLLGETAAYLALPPPKGRIKI